MELSKSAEHVVLVGPATTGAPYLLTRGLDDLSGFIIKDTEKAIRIASGTENVKMSRSGQKVSLKRKEAYNVL